MALAEERTHATREQLPVENPATGEVIRTLPVTTPEEVEQAVMRARLAQPEWDDMGFEGRAKVLRRAQKWLVDNAERVIQTIVDETGKAWEDAQLAELGYGAHAFGFWAKKAPEYLADQKVKSGSPFVAGRKMTMHPGRHFGWWAEGRFASGRLFMKTWWPTEGLARTAARLVGGGSPITRSDPH